MNLLGGTISILFGLATLFVGIYSEFKWRMMLAKWQKTSGIITAEIDDGGETTSPEIEFEFNGEKRRFVSAYGGGTVHLSRTVVVLFNPETGDAEEYKWSNKWLPTIASLGFGAVFLIAGLTTAFES